MSDVESYWLPNNASLYSGLPYYKLPEGKTWHQYLTKMWYYMQYPVFDAPEGPRPYSELEFNAWELLLLTTIFECLVVPQVPDKIPDVWTGGGDVRIDWSGTPA